MKFTRSMAFSVNKENDALIAKLSNIALLRYILFAFDEISIGVTDKQKEFINSLCVWLSTNATLTAGQMQSAVQLCLQHRERTESLIEEFSIIDVDSEKEEPLPFES